MPSLPTDGLEELAEALREDDHRLIQQATTCPPPLSCVHEWTVEAADAIAFVGWHSEIEGVRINKVGEVEEFFARSCFECDKRMNEPAACRYFLNAYDEWPRDEMRRELLAEVELELYGRDVQPSTAVEREPELIEQLPF